MHVRAHESVSADYGLESAPEYPALSSSSLPLISLSFFLLLVDFNCYPRLNRHYVICLKMRAHRFFPRVFPRAPPPRVPSSRFSPSTRYNGHCYSVHATIMEFSAREFPLALNSSLVFFASPEQGHLQAPVVALLVGELAIFLPRLSPSPLRKSRLQMLPSLPSLFSRRPFRLSLHAAP